MDIEWPSAGKKTHSRTHSDITEHRSAAGTPRVPQPLSACDQLRINRNITVLTEKQKIFEKKGKELTQISELLQKKKENLNVETQLLSKKVAECCLKKEKLSQKLEKAKLKRKNLRTEFQLKSEQIAILKHHSGQTPQNREKYANLTRSQSRKSTNQLKTELIQFSSEVIQEENDLVQFALKIKEKQEILEQNREEFCLKRKNLESILLETKNAEKSAFEIENENEELQEQILSLVKVAGKTRNEMQKIESISSEQSLKTEKMQTEVKNIENEISSKEKLLINLQSKLRKNKEKAEMQEKKIMELHLAEEEIYERVKLKLAKDSDWKSIHFADVKAILDCMQRIRAREDRIMFGKKALNRRSV